MHHVFAPRSVIRRARPSAPESKRSIRLPFGALAIFATPGSVMNLEFLRGMSAILSNITRKEQGDMRVTREKIRRGKRRNKVKMFYGEIKGFVRSSWVLDEPG